MPRVKRRGHKQNERQFSGLTRAELIRLLVDGAGAPDVHNPALAVVPERERAAVVEQAWEIYFAEREARREPILKERLETWPADAWGTVFAERPDLEDTLTDEQCERWQARQDEVKRVRLRETHSNVVEMPTKVIS